MSKFFQWIDYYWRKQYIKFYLFLTFIGSFAVWFFKGKLNDYLIFYTLIAILWYTRETMDLKRNSNREIKLLKEAEMNKMMPLLIFQEGARLFKDGNLSAFCVINRGSGIARSVEILLGSVTIEENFTLAPTDTRTIRTHGNKEYIVNIIKENPTEIYMEIRYKDIYERLFRTVEISFTRDPDSNYNLDRGKWKFQRLD